MNTPYTLEFTHHRNARTMRLKLFPNGRVVVSAPTLTPRFLMHQFANQHKAWIEQKLRQLSTRKKVIDPQANQVLLFGKTYELVVQNNLKQPIGVHVQQSCIVINVIGESTKQKQLQRFLKSSAQHYIHERVGQLAKKMNCTYANVTLKQQKTRWGSCSSKGNLNFNWRLVHFEPAVIDYVIIHELAHRAHMNHSPSFWKLVGQFDPQFRAHKKILNQHGTMDEI